MLSSFLMTTRWSKWRPTLPVLNQRSLGRQAAQMPMFPNPMRCKPAKPRPPSALDATARAASQRLRECRAWSDLTQNISSPRSRTTRAGNARTKSCAGCHGEQGISATPTTPSLAGQDAEYLSAALLAYKDGQRSNETMKGLTSGLDETKIKNLAAYYAGLQPEAPKVRKPLTTQEWTERCERCHGLNGNSTNPR